MSEKAIEKKKQDLPKEPEKLAEFIIIGQEILKAQRAKISAIKSLGMAKNVADEALSEAQGLATNVLHAECKLGKILKATLKHGRPKKGRTGATFLKNFGLNKVQSSRFQTMAEHPDIVKEAIKTAEVKEEIPTRKAVLSLIAQRLKYGGKEDIIVEDLEDTEIETPYRLYYTYNDNTPEYAAALKDLFPNQTGYRCEDMKTLFELLPTEVRRGQGLLLWILNE